MFTQPALADGRQVIAVDLPGHGGSAKQLDHADAESLAASIEHVLNTLGIERLHLVGHLMGGGIAISFAARHRERVATLTLISSASLGPEINGAFIDIFVRAAPARSDRGTQAPGPRPGARQPLNGRGCLALQEAGGFRKR